MPSLNKYHDYHINPAVESIESIKEKIIIISHNNDERKWII